MSDDTMTRLRQLREVLMGNPIMAREVQEAMDEIERLRELAKALYEESKRCGSKHDVKATNDWENYEQEVRGE